MGRAARQTHHIGCGINGELEPVARGELAPGILVGVRAVLISPTLAEKGTQWGESSSVPAKSIEKTQSSLTTHGMRSASEEG